MSPIERIQAVLAGQKPDRMPFSFWYHFPPSQAHGQAAVQAHLDHLGEFDLDFLKVMNENPYPPDQPIRTIDDLKQFHELNGDEPGFVRQYELLRELRAAIRGRVFMVTTIFNAWATLRGMVKLTEETSGHSIEASNRWIRTAWRRDVQTVEAALGIIAVNLAKFATRCLDAGADGIFLSVRDDWVEGREGDEPASMPSFDQLVRPLDMMILRAADSAAFNILHVCGKSLNLRRFNDYPVHAMNWADRSAGPAITDVKDWLRPAICAGVNHEKTLITGTPEDVSREVSDAIRQAGDRPIIIAPGCTFDPARVPPANLHAIRPLDFDELSRVTV